VHWDVGGLKVWGETGMKAGTNFVKMKKAGTTM
jgi:hypothetical protein